MNALEIKEFREKHGLTQQNLAEIVGVSKRAVQSWEQGNRNVSQSVIKILNDFDNQPDLDQMDSKIRKAALDCVENWDQAMKVEGFRTKVYEQLGHILNVDFDEIIKSGVISLLKKED
ncbi:helix-turn-helix domain-containing protein [Aquimarina spongiae]|uniref:Helix-turn-helix n=1 Tax=Aquimarina spongiae TaxID=570521 RepID=A0A1M6JDX6_9FLAO|nr:helix-turn-helix domain-containing protein [Aquimarina spongiae]SHJ44888.1 Helix-turn-helix [Aquimarina spongiae]